MKDTAIDAAIDDIDVNALAWVLFSHEVLEAVGGSEPKRC